MNTPALPAPAPRRKKTLKLHGDQRVDEYFWLRNRKDPAVMKYLKAENKYYDETLKPLASLRKKLFKEMKSRIKEQDSTPPAPMRGYTYQSRYEKGKQYPLYCRKPMRGKKEQILLDGNRLARGKKYFHTTGYSISPDDQRIILSADFDGSERYQLLVREIETGKALSKPIPNSNGSFTWALDNRTLFYVVLDENLRPYRVYRHRLGDDPKRDELIYEEKDAQYFVDVSRTRSNRFILIESAGKVTTEVWVIDSNRPTQAPRCFQKRLEGVEYSVEHRDGEFWILTNDRAENFQVMKTPVHSTGRKNWKTVIPVSKKIFIEDMEIFSNYLILSELEGGLPHIRVRELKGNKSHRIAVDDPAYSISIDTNLEFDTHTLRYRYSSPIVPDSTYDYDLRKRRRKLLKIKQVKGHRPANYRCERVWAPSHDGTRVPMTIVYRKGFKKNGSAPGYLYGYGSYGASMPDSFSMLRDAYRLIDRGFVYALAHPRGGSEMGRRWYEDGKFLKKKNTFKDFIACGDYLVSKGYVARDKLATCGGSAGGMLMGACMNMRPDLFRAVAAHVPFVDVLNTMLDRDLPLTQIEYKEWGNPDDPRYYRYIKSYSPYDNVTAKDYPALFVTCGLNDPRVTYWEPAKWVARLRALKTGSSPIVFKTNMSFGHFGASGRFDHLHQISDEYAFILKTLGLRLA